MAAYNESVRKYFSGDRDLRRVELIDLTQADGNTLASSSDRFNVNATDYVVSATGTAGTLAFSVQINEETGFEELIDPATGNQQMIDLSDAQSFVIPDQGLIDIRVEPTGVSGNYSVYIKQSVE